MTFLFVLIRHIYSCVCTIDRKIDDCTEDGIREFLLCFPSSVGISIDMIGRFIKERKGTWSIEKEEICVCLH